MASKIKVHYPTCPEVVPRRRSKLITLIGRLPNIFKLYPKSSEDFELTDPSCSKGG